MGKMSEEIWEKFLGKKPEKVWEKIAATVLTVVLTIVGLALAITVAMVMNGGD